MGRSEVTVRWPMITICTSIGSTISDMITVWNELQRVDNGEPEGWRGGLVRCTLIKEEAGEAAEWGLQ